MMASTSIAPSRHPYAGRTFTVDRRTWCRGTYDSSLLRDDGMGCCLGHIAQQCGIPLSRLRNSPGPFVADWEEMNIDKYPQVGAMMRINDNLDISDAEREVALQGKAAEMGFTLVFIN